MGYIIGFAAYPSEMGLKFLLLDFSRFEAPAPAACALGLLNEMQSKRLRVDEVPCPIWTSLDGLGTETKNYADEWRKTTPLMSEGG